MSLAVLGGRERCSSPSGHRSSGRRRCQDPGASGSLAAPWERAGHRGSQGLCTAGTLAGNLGLAAAALVGAHDPAALPPGTLRKESPLRRNFAHRSSLMPYCVNLPKPPPVHHPPWASPSRLAPPWDRAGGTELYADRKFPASPPPVRGSPTSRRRPPAAAADSGAAPWQHREARSGGKLQGDPFLCAEDRKRNAEIHVTRMDSPRRGVGLCLGPGVGKGKQHSKHADSGDTAAAIGQVPQQGRSHRQLRHVDPNSSSPRRARLSGTHCPVELYPRTQRRGLGRYASPSPDGRAGAVVAARSQGRRAGDPFAAHRGCKEATLVTLRPSAAAPGEDTADASRGRRVPQRTLGHAAGEAVARALCTASAPGGAARGSPQRKGFGSDKNRAMVQAYAEEPWSKSEQPRPGEGTRGGVAGVEQRFTRAWGTPPRSGPIAIDDWIAL
eukprot:TRINITY_DN608_c0_g4_i1.p1 TRINITY_DN608_c0_g4~~TRINITY_DN608_c0_g4_i1.p1  ORF type:complete len:463 (+),score=30.10 TRINITY_DN608_c0_g4_i1:66-1391(+)